VALIVVGVIAWLAFQRMRSQQLRQRFGPEYERTVHEHGNTAKAEAELADRSRRVQRLSIQPLPPASRQRYADLWRQEQEKFVDEPKVAVVEADHLVEEVMRERGYPVGEFDQRVADISVDHPRVVEHYRMAHDIALAERRGQASTEDLRQAMVHYRNLFMELLEEPMPKGAPAR